MKVVEIFIISGLMIGMLNIDYFRFNKLDLSTGCADRG
jgi:hypothetical protein